MPFVILSLVIFSWVLLTFVSLVAMYHLWWTREACLYGGKRPSEQRVEVVKRGGIPIETLNLAYQADQDWPPGISYRADGSEVALSYFKYLVIPRVPAGSDVFRISETKTGGYELSGCGGDFESVSSFHTQPPSPRGLILSLTVVLAVAAFFRRFGFSMPQQVAGSVFSLYTITVFLKPLTRSYMPVGMFFCVLGAIGLTFFLARKPWAQMGRFTPWKKDEVWFCFILGGILAAGCIWAFLMAVVVLPDDWDAWAQWGPKAKLLALSAGPLRDVSFFVTGSGDYPLLWPSVWAFSGWCAGGWEDQWSTGWGAIFFALAAWQLKIVYQKVGGGRMGGLLVAALFVSMPAVPLVASWGYAEAPYWLMLTCATSELIAWQQQRDRKYLWYASVFVASASATKNEGIMFSVLCTMWVVFCSRSIKDLFAVSIMPFLFIASWRIYVVLAIGTSNHAVRAITQSGFDVSTMSEMPGYALSYIVRQWLDPRQWNIVMPLLLAGSFWFVIKGVWRTRILLLLPYGMLGGLLLVILLYGENWKWQLHVAWNRLTIQFLAVLFPVLAAASAAFVKKCPQAD
jgi:hypothetical protein